MATAMAQGIPTITLGVAEDDMEISSDLGRYADENNIDIEIDVGEENPEPFDDDFMVDGDDALANQELPKTASFQLNNDDLMIDEERDAVEQGIQNTETTAQDEELSDASVDGEEDVDIFDEKDNSISENSTEMTKYPPIDSSKDLTGSDHTSSLLTNVQRQDERQIEDISNGTEVKQSKSAGEAKSVQQSQNPSDTTSLFRLHSQSIKDKPDFSDELSTYDAAHDDLDNSADSQQVTNEKPMDHPYAVVTPDMIKPQNGTIDGTIERAPLALNDGNAESVINSNPQAADAVEENAVPPSHPIIAIYEEQEISLFPPSDQQTSEIFFLADQALINESIKALLDACRTVLGESIDEDQELEIDVAELGLSVNEDSIHAPTLTLADLLDLYLHLCRHDGIDVPEPLYVTIRTKFRLPACLARLRDAVKNGIGLSQLKLATDCDDLYDTTQADDCLPSGDKDDQDPRPEVISVLPSQPTYGDISADSDTTLHKIPSEATSTQRVPQMPDLSHTQSAMADEIQRKVRDSDTVSGKENVSARVVGIVQSEDAADDFIDFSDAEDEEILEPLPLPHASADHADAANVEKQSVALADDFQDHIENANDQLEHNYHDDGEDEGEEESLEEIVSRTESKHSDQATKLHDSVRQDNTDESEQEGILKQSLLEVGHGLYQDLPDAASEEGYESSLTAEQSAFTEINNAQQLLDDYTDYEHTVHAGIRDDDGHEFQDDHTGTSTLDNVENQIRADSDRVFADEAEVGIAQGVRAEAQLHDTDSENQQRGHKHASPASVHSILDNTSGVTGRQQMSKKRSWRDEDDTSRDSDNDGEKKRVRSSPSSTIR